MRSQATPLLYSLRKHYRTYLRGGEWLPCEQAFKQVCGYVLSDGRDAVLRACLAQAHDDDVLNPAVAQRRIARALPLHERLELTFAHELGFKSRRCKRWKQTAHTEAGRLVGELKPLPGYVDEHAILAFLNHTHMMVKQCGPTGPVISNRRRRVQTRKFARREVDRRIYIVGMVLANGDEPAVFDLSYALSSGVRAYPPAAGRRVPESIKRGWKAT